MADSEEVVSSIDSKCTPLKVKYDTCFNSWFKSSFLKGQDNHNEECGQLFEEYKKCLNEALKEKGLPMDELNKNILDTTEERQPPSK